MVQFISGTHPLIYLFMYFAAIPLFACLYGCYMPHDFYAPYVKLEPGANVDKERLAEDIVQGVRRSLSKSSWTSADEDGWQSPKPTNLYARDLDSIDGKQVTFKMWFDILKGEYMRAHELWHTFLAIKISNESWTRIGVGTDAITFRPVDVDRSSTLPPKVVSRLIETLFTNPEVGSTTLAFNLRQDIDYENYLKGVNGDPGAVGGQESRMLYLSSVVLTTLGLGDIVPMTDHARGFVAAEAIWGIAFAGLFLNAVAYRASRGKG
jgi:hypothetical protein